MLGSVKRDAYLKAPNVGQMQLRIVDVSCFSDTSDLIQYIGENSGIVFRCLIK